MTPFLGRSGPGLSWWGRCAAACLVVAACLAPARADSDAITECLLRETPDLMDFLLDHKFETVGVLKFEVKDGPAAPSMHVGLLNAKVAEELEAALVLSLSDKNPLGVIHNATAAAFKQDPQASCETAADRRKLFDYDYPLAWGKSKVKAAVFLTGVVSLGADKDGKSNPKKTHIQVKAFDRSGDFLQVWDFEARTDRVLLADSGKGFKLSKAPLGSKSIGLAPAQEADARALKGGDVQGYPVSLKVLYGGSEQAMKEDDGAGKLNCFRVAPPRIDQQVSFVVKNEGDKKVGIVLCVNGLNTLYEEPEGCPAEMHKWVLEPGKDILIEGFYGEDRKSVYPFNVVPPAANKVAGLPFADSESIGLITLHVLPEGDSGEPAEVLRGGKGLRFPTQGARASRADLKKALDDSGSGKSKDLISKEQKPKPDEIGFNPLNNPILKETRVIRYADPTP